MRISDWSSDVCSSDLLADFTGACGNGCDRGPAADQCRAGGRAGPDRGSGSGADKGRVLAIRLAGNFATLGETCSGSAWPSLAAAAAIANLAGAMKELFQHAATTDWKSNRLNSSH